MFQNVPSGSIPDIRFMGNGDGGGSQAAATAASASAAGFPSGLAQAISGLVQNAIDGTIAGAQGMGPGHQFEMSFHVDVSEAQVMNAGSGASGTNELNSLRNSSDSKLPGAINAAKKASGSLGPNVMVPNVPKLKSGIPPISPPKSITGKIE